MVHRASTTRRRLLATLGVGTIAIAGCAASNGDPTYERGEVDESGGSPRTAAEMAAAEALAQQEANEAATSLDSLEIEDHEFVVEDGFKGPTVQGRVTNDGDDAATLVEARVRVFGSNGAQLGRYLDSTGDLDAGTTWQFEVILLTPVTDVAGYDVAVLGIPG